MTESPTPGKFAKWKRPLIGGLLSALLAGVILISQSSGILFVGSAVPVWMFIPPTTDNVPMPVVPFAMLLWFLMGAVIAHIERNNMRAFLSWLILHAIFFSIAIALCFLCS